MRFDNEGMSLWFGTPDAPSPGDTVPAGMEIAITIAVQPGDRNNKVEVLYRVNNGPAERATAKWLRNDSRANVQYFRAQLPPRLVGDRVEYTPLCHRAGRSVPSEGDTKHTAASFSVTEGTTQPPHKVIPGEGVSTVARNDAAIPATYKPLVEGDRSQSGDLNGSDKLPSPTISETGHGVIHSKDNTIGTERHTKMSTGSHREPTENAAAPPSYEGRINTINSVLSTKEDQEAVKAEILATKGDWVAALANLKEKLPHAAFQKVALAHSLAVWSDDNVSAVKAILVAQPNVKDLRDLALEFNVDKLTALVDPEALPEGTPGVTAEEKRRNFAVSLRQKLFSAEPTAVLQRMVEDAEVPIADVGVRSGVAKFLSGRPDFNIRATSIYSILKDPEALKDIADEHRAAVIDNLKTLQRVQAIISSAPEAVPVLIKANLTSAFQVAQMPESTFLRVYGRELDDEAARQIHKNAVDIQIRNDNALITMRETMRGTGLAIIDGKSSVPERIASLQAVADAKGVPLNLETLFGGMDYCECDECLSVYSPAAYFVELLQFLRNNNLGPDPATGGPPGSNPNIHPGIAGTPLEKLFRRRPDLGCLELTCENTFTVLPYIDLVNEVMESFVVHLGNYHDDKNIPKQAMLDAFNVEGETSSELLAIPQHINYEAYCILKNAVYPFTLPYHQPIDAIRIFLDYLKTSRYELLDTYRTAKLECVDDKLSDADRKDLQLLHQIVQDRAVDAEFLGMSQEEYIILVKEAFGPKHYFEITQQTTYTDDEYRQNIGVRQVCEYYGYIPKLKEAGDGTCDAEMLSTDEDPNTGQKGLAFVKKQFLPRTGIQYTDLVELLKTQFINPDFPQGKALAILESIRLSYRFLQTLVNTNGKTPAERFGQLILFLQTYQPPVPLIVDPCHPQKSNCCSLIQDLEQWVYCYFDKIAKLIVLESGEGPQLPIEGQLFAEGGPTFIGTLHKDGKIINEKGELIGNTTFDGRVVASGGAPFLDNYKLSVIEIRDGQGGKVGLIIDHGHWDQDGVWVVLKSGLFSYKDLDVPVAWLLPRDTCDLDKVRLTHLDGTALCDDEYDRMHRFIRLWRKLGWTTDETDKALIGLAGTPGASAMPETCNYVDFKSFNRVDGDTRTDCGCEVAQTLPCPEVCEAEYDITPDFLHQLVAVKKLLDSTGLPLPKLLAFWADISTAGEKSLYSKLFLTHNLVAIDSIFQADANGNYLSQQPSAKIGDHIPVLMAALKLKADDLSAITSFALATDDLTLSNVSMLYRYSLLAKLLHVRAPLLQDVTDLFGDPFKNAWDSLALVETWGKMEDAGFTFRQLDYLILNRDDLLRPLAPSQKTILQLAKTLYDGLNAIDQNNRDITDKEEATSDLVRSKAGLLFDQSIVEQIIGLLEGTNVYTTNAPPNLTINIKDTDPLNKKLKYTDQKGSVPPSVQVTGILTDDEKTAAKALSNDKKWSDTIDRVGKQPLHLIFDDILFGIFSGKTAEAQSILLAGDYNNPSNPQDEKNSAPDKRRYFLQTFLPFLRGRLYQRLIVDTTSASAGLAGDITQLLLSEVLLVGTPPQSAMAVLQKIKDLPPESPADFTGYLIPSADDQYTFVAIADKAPSLMIGGDNVPFPYQQDDPSDVWSSDPMKLKAGKIYRLQLTKDRPEDQLQWKTSTSPRAPIPASALLPDYSSKGTEEAFVKLYKAGIPVNGFNLSGDEISYLQTHKTDFDGFDFNAVALQHWERLQAYTDLRNSLPRTETPLIDLFKWANKPDDPAKLSDKIAAATTWKNDAIDKLIAPDPNDPKEHFDLNHPENFRNEVNLVKLRQAVAVADKIAVDIDRLFEWAKPGSNFWVCHQIAEDIRKAIRARFTEDDWEQVVKPLNDQLREHQKQALIAYLLVQPDLKDWGVIDADSLFEFFLIDVQMDACMETSRIKQAISSVQLFIQRCLLGEEEKYGLPNNAVDRGRWEWMQRYRVWEANRKVFLYPENWIDPQLRDDKSPFYIELESELLQKDINTQTVEDALKSYLFKVEEIANLKVVGLFTDEVEKKLHVFSRKRNAPYFFYYRYFGIKEKNWYPWEKIQVDIPSYDAEDGTAGQLKENGAYLIPVVWNKRLLVFYPQFVKKTAPTSPLSNVAFKTIADKSPADAKPTEFWEIKMAWSEYCNKKWTQKQLSTQVVYHARPPNPNISLEESIRSYAFVPRIVGGDKGEVVISLYHRDEQSIGAFSFANGQLLKNDAWSLPKLPFNTDFHQFLKTNATEMHSLQAVDQSDPSSYNIAPYFKFSVAEPIVGLLKTDETSDELNFYHPFIHELLGKLTAGSLDDLFNYYLQRVINLSDPKQLDATAMAETYGDNGPNLYHELKRSYSIYNWEPGFHVLMQLADKLLKAQQFEQALKMCQYVLNPHAAGDPADRTRFWQFPPFKDVKPDQILENLFLDLQPGQPDERINEWRDKPFWPHVVARGRPAAYMKYVAMKYIEILIAWGDYLFRQDTIETINQATQLYVLAAHVYGPKGQKIPKRGKVKPETYNALLDKWDAFGNAMIELELVFPFSNQTPLQTGNTNGVIGLPNIFGFATTLYFCIPDNPQLRTLRDNIDDRLFKIRHCENIQGIFRQLPLFEPPIDPALLVQAAAQGLSLSSVLNDLNSPMPNYRFYYLLQKALEVCNELKALGAAFLSAKEKGDGEALSRLRAMHESAIQNLVMEVRKQQFDEATKSLESLQQSRLGPANRMEHYLLLISEDSGKIPKETADFEALAEPIEPPVNESGLKVNHYEKEEGEKGAEARLVQIGIGVIETLTSIVNMVPNFSVNAQPFGVGGSISFGGSNLGASSQGMARAAQIGANELSYQSTNAGRTAGFLRQFQDRILQANTAGFEIKNIDKQILTQNIRINIANQEITNQQKQIDNAREMEDFLRNKYTNQELYSWMEGQIRTLYYQAYTLAYDLAKRAEKVFRFERFPQDSAAPSFIQPGYWDPAYDGLFAGERLYIGLKQLEAAYQETRGYDFEIVKNISLQQLNPLALVELRETGRCEFALPEVLFDMGYPGHYMRRIKTAALTFACLVGPTTSINCTLRLVEHEFRVSPSLKNGYQKHTDETDDRFSTVNVPITSIAVSTGQNDSGVFELNFRDERYIPFEGAGAISKWSIELPTKFREFGYESITDVVMHLRYTAVDGGDKLRGAAEGALLQYISSVEDLSKDEGLFAFFDLRHDFPNEWYKVVQAPTDGAERSMDLGNLYDRLPIFTRIAPLEKTVAAEVYLFTSSALTAGDLTLLQNNDEHTFGDCLSTDCPSIGTMKSMVTTDVGPLSNWRLKFSIQKKNTLTQTDQLWLVARYTIAGSKSSV